MQQNKKTLKLTLQDVVIIGVMIAALEVGKLVLSGVPNVEVVSLLIILFTLFFGLKVYYAIFVFIAIEGLLYGFGYWWFSYLYVWPLLALLTYLFRRCKSVWFYSAFSGVFGLLFGALCSIVMIFLSGPKAAFGWWVAGIPWDMVHGISNFILMMILYIPLRRVFERYPHNP